MRLEVVRRAVRRGERAWIREHDPGAVRFTGSVGAPVDPVHGVGRVLDVEHGGLVRHLEVSHRRAVRDDVRDVDVTLLLVARHVRGHHATLRVAEDDDRLALACHAFLRHGLTQGRQRRSFDRTLAAGCGVEVAVAVETVLAVRRERRGARQDERPRPLTRCRIDDALHLDVPGVLGVLVELRDTPGRLAHAPHLRCLGRRVRVGRQSGAHAFRDACENDRGGVQGRDVLGVGAGQHIGDDLDDHVDGIGCLALDRGQIDVLARDGIRDDVVELQAGHDEVGGEG